MTDLANIPRDSRRVPLETRVQFKFDRFSGFLSEYSANISPGGMYIRSQSPQELGTVLDFEFRLGDGYELIRGRGEVVWSRAYDEGPRRPAGMGIRFLELSEGSLDLIYKIVDQHVLQGGTPFDVSREPSLPTATSALLPPLDPFPEALEPDPRRAAGPSLATPPVAPASPYGEPGDPLDESILTLHGLDRRPRASPAPANVEAPPDARSWMPPFEELEASSAMVLKSPDEAADEAWAPPKVPVPTFVPTFGAATAAEARGSRRALPGILLIASVSILAVGAFLLRDRLPGWLGIGGGEDPPIRGGVRPDLPRTRPSPDALPAEGASSEVATAPDASGSPEPSGPTAASPDQLPEPAPVAAASPIERPPVSAQRAQSVPPPTAPAAGNTVASAPATTNPPVEAKGFTALERITFEKGVDGTDIDLWLDGAVSASRYVRSDLTGPSPRVLIKLRGVVRAFPGGKVAVGSGEVLQIRTGYHGEGGLNELHVVLDLTRATVKVSRIEVQPRRLRIHLQGK